MRKKATLVLEDGTVFTGQAMGSEGVARGVLACHGMAAGFPDLVTDPSYGGKMLCFTYPHIGNAGVVPDELQGESVAVRAVIAREFSKIKANRLGVETFDDFLRRNGVPAIEDVDTRTVAQAVLEKGRLRAVLGCGEFADAEALAGEFAREHPDWAPVRAGVAEAYDFGDAASEGGKVKKVVVYDFGVKRGFLRRLAGMGFAVRVVPAERSVSETLADGPDGVVFSAGPGVPDERPAAVKIAGELLGKLPVWGIGLGAGILARAAGANVVVNGRSHIGVQPVGRPGGSSAEMTAQCHDFWIEGESLVGAGLAQTHFHLNDGSVEGFRCESRRFMGVLFHPESEPGPRDSLYLFDRFHQMLRGQ